MAIEVCKLIRRIVSEEENNVFDKTKVPTQATDVFTQLTVTNIIIPYMLANNKKGFLSLSLTSHQINGAINMEFERYCESSLYTLQSLCPEIISVSRIQLQDKGIAITFKQLYIETYHTLENLISRHLKRDLYNDVNAIHFLDKIKRGITPENAIEMYKLLQDLNLIILYRLLRGVNLALLNDFNFINISNIANNIREYINTNPAIINNITMIDGTDDFGLNLIPPEIGRLVALQWLYLPRNQIQAIPPAIGQLVALQYLDLSYNQIRTIPREIGQLGVLRELCLNDNLIQTIPTEFGQLKSLERLFLSRNQIQEIFPPEVVVQLAHCKICM